MAQLQSFTQLLPTIILSLVYGGVGLVGMLVMLFKIGPRRFFYMQERKQRPAIMEDPSLGKHDTVQLKSVKLHYVANGDAGKPLMLFLHGFPECWFSWRHQIRHFSSNYRTVAVDMRGYGESDKPNSVSDYTMDKLVEDIKELIPALGYERCVLVAHDWGGAVAGQFAATYPELLDRLILINIPHAKAFRRHMMSSTTQFRSSWYMFMFQWPLMGEYFLRADDFSGLGKMFMAKPKGCVRPACTAEELEAYKYSLGQPGGLTCPLNYYRATFRYQHTLPPSDITKVPTHMIWGEQDTALEKPLAELSKDHISGLGITFIPTGSHWSLMEEYEQVNRAMENFLSGKKSE